MTPVTNDDAVEYPSTQRKPVLPGRLLALARQLRRQQTDAEAKLWFLLRDRRFLGLKFRRQVPMEAYVLDFYCHELRLAVELDGGQHKLDGHQERDNARTQALAAHRIAIVRFWNDAFLRDVQGTLEAMYIAVQDRRQALGMR